MARSRRNVLQRVDHDPSRSLVAGLFVPDYGWDGGLEVPTDQVAFVGLQALQRPLFGLMPQLDQGLIEYPHLDVDRVLLWGMVSQCEIAPFFGELDPLDDAVFQ